MPPFELHHPKTIDEAMSLARSISEQRPPLHSLAGRLRQLAKNPATLVSKYRRCLEPGIGYILSGIRSRGMDSLHR